MTTKVRHPKEEEQFVLKKSVLNLLTFYHSSKWGREPVFPCFETTPTDPCVQLGSIKLRA